MTKNTQPAPAYRAGYADRLADRPMRESFDLLPADANQYVNGYRAACEAAANQTQPA